MWETGELIIAVAVSFVLGGILSFLFARWFFLKKFQEAEKIYQESTRKSYQEMASLFGRKMKEEDLNRLTTQMEEASKKREMGTKKSKSKKK